MEGNLFEIQWYLHETAPPFYEVSSFSYPIPVEKKRNVKIQAKKLFGQLSNEDARFAMIKMKE